MTVDLTVWTPGVLLIVGLAAFRLWVLVSSDTILAPVRDRLPLGVVEFLSCPWCSGFWVVLGVFVAVELWGDGAGVQLAVIILALSALVGVFAVLTSGGDR